MMKKTKQRNIAVFFHSVYAVIYESKAFVMCLRLDVLFLLDEDTVNNSTAFRL